MRFASFTTPDGSDTWGAAVDGALYDLGPSGANLADSLKDAIAEGLLDHERISLQTLPAIPERDVAFLPVIPDPAKILCIGVNYKTHREETGRAEVSAPTVFTRFADTLLGHDQPTIRPATTEQFDFEGELAIIIGSPAHKVSEADAWRHIAGMAAFNDFSVRDWQRATTQWTPGKNFPATGAFGPYFVPVADVDDFDGLRLETRVNGETRQSALLGDLIFTVPQLVAHVTGFTALRPGDVIVTGTPGGVGLFSDPPRMLIDGDVVEVEIGELGVLRNVVQQEVA
ncbi:fumarylacetoacetate hydrolase family protein [Ruicaihuangia caeni]|uniref:Fumarylacetoacetate hydrolase family protein n=1 Tax=Ruicaihuangia caeni TaxID=3042517 RepID=A0AAW6T8Y0_9MICO|nr:fumarylacetoacetate hydrolase family protein [Klugiella sp. YN-L-19]MDI2099236.1 fumarylacetoacetate hydrolase family protein [Klugiella sp. YN-L-19]